MGPKWHLTTAVDRYRVCFSHRKVFTLGRGAWIVQFHYFIDRRVVAVFNKSYRMAPLEPASSEDVH